MDIVFRQGTLTPAEQLTVSRGFEEHSALVDAPGYSKELLHWLVPGQKPGVRGVLTAELLWDWLYIDELWISPELRGSGLGRRLMMRAEEFAREQQLSGIWLWTQSWQAEEFYRKLGYAEFTRFDNFPKGHARIGFRKAIPSAGAS
jgi:ribosomal protein S18 acetylase RimI-like enzyme